jgi:nicotinamide-nucleotide amidase
MNDYRVELISIGNELLAGYTINTNAAYLSRKLQNIGLPVNWTTVISDQHDEILRALQTAAERAAIVLVTGGLGPTPDDITKKSIAEYFKVPFTWNDQALDDVKRFLAQRGREITEINRLQAYIPDCDQVIYNPVGTAPGLVFQRGDRHFFFMPGVPLEMQYMTERFILDYLKQRLILPQMQTRILRTTGIAESRLYEVIQDLCAAYPQFPISFLPRHIGVDLRFRCIAAASDQCVAFQKFLEIVHTRIHKYVFTDEEIEMEQKIGELLRERGLRLATAESFTAGLLGDLITNIPGSSDYYLGGVIAYSNESKIRLLDVSEATLQEYGAVSVQTVIEMARGVRSRFNSDCAIATTGIAGPGGATPAKPVGFSYMAALCGERESVREFRLGAQRDINKKRGATIGMEMLRRLLLNIE